MTFNCTTEIGTLRMEGVESGANKITFLRMKGHIQYALQSMMFYSYWQQTGLAGSFSGIVSINSKVKIRRWNLFLSMTSEFGTSLNQNSVLPCFSFPAFDYASHYAHRPITLARRWISGSFQCKPIQFSHPMAKYGKAHTAWVCVVYQYHMKYIILSTPSPQQQNNERKKKTQFGYELHSNQIMSGFHIQFRFPFHPVVRVVCLFMCHVVNSIYRPIQLFSLLIMLGKQSNWLQFCTHEIACH